MTTYYLINDRVRENALQAVRANEAFGTVSVLPKRRSNEQSSKMWTMLKDVADAKPEGRQWTPEAWKAAFMHYLGHQVAFAEGLDGSGPFPYGFRSSKLSTKQMSDLIECIYKYGAENKVKWNETKKCGWIDERDEA